MLSSKDYSVASSSVDYYNAKGVVCDIALTDKSYVVFSKKDQIVNGTKYKLGLALNMVDFQVVR